MYFFLTNKYRQITKNFPNCLLKTLFFSLTTELQIFLFRFWLHYLTQQKSPYRLIWAFKKYFLIKNAVLFVTFFVTCFEFINTTSWVNKFHLTCIVRVWSVWYLEFYNWILFTVFPNNGFLCFHGWTWKESIFVWHAPYNYCWKQKGIFVSEWIPASGTQPAKQIALEYPFDKYNTTPEGKLADDTTLILTLGIEFGKPVYGNLIEPVKYAGTGKVLRVGWFLV